MNKLLIYLLIFCYGLCAAHTMIPPAIPPNYKLYKSNTGLYMCTDYKGIGVEKLQ